MLQRNLTPKLLLFPLWKTKVLVAAPPALDETTPMTPPLD